MDALVALISEAVKTDYIKMTAAFTAAAYMHRRWVKKDMKEHFATFTEALNKVARTVADGLANHSQRIDGLESNIQTLTNRVDTLEKPKGE